MQSLLPVISLDEVLIPGKHLYFLLLAMNFRFYFNHFLLVTNLNEVLPPGNHLYFLVFGDELWVLFGPFRYPVTSFLI